MINLEDKQKSKFRHKIWMPTERQEKNRVISREYYNKNKRDMKTVMRRYRKKYPAVALRSEIQERLRAFQDKITAFYIVSKGDISCACCGLRDLDFLTIDHINNDGATERKKNGETRGGRILYKRLIKNNFESMGKYQLLCFNCNCAKGFYGCCPHTKRNSMRVFDE